MWLLYIPQCWQNFLKSRFINHKKYGQTLITKRSIYYRLINLWPAWHRFAFMIMHLRLLVVDWLLIIFSNNKKTGNVCIHTYSIFSLLILRSVPMSVWLGLSSIETIPATRILRSFQFLKVFGTRITACQENAFGTMTIHIGSMNFTFKEYTWLEYWWCQNKTLVRK